MELKGRNEGIAYVKGMVNQHSSYDMEYPSGTNMRGGATAAGGPEKAASGRERHAEGDMVGEEKKAMGGMMNGPRSGAMRGPQSGAMPEQEMKCGGKMRK